MSARPCRAAASALASVLAVALAFVGYGCTSGEEAEDEPAASEDAIGLRRGSVDHTAIVEVTTMMLVGPPTDFPTVLDPYNQEDPFGIRNGSFAEGFARNLTKFDAYDGKTDWLPAQASTWVRRVASGNYLVVDTSKPCDFYAPRTYLEIERAQMTGRPHTTCGGRMPNEDAMDVTLNWLIRGPSASAQDAEAIRDGVDYPTKLSVDTFPYLGEMNGF